MADNRAKTPLVDANAPSVAPIHDAKRRSGGNATRMKRASGGIERLWAWCCAAISRVFPKCFFVCRACTADKARIARA